METTAESVMNEDFQKPIIIIYEFQSLSVSLSGMEAVSKKCEKTKRFYGSGLSGTLRCRICKMDSA